MRSVDQEILDEASDVVRREGSCSVIQREEMTRKADFVDVRETTTSWARLGSSVQHLRALLVSPTSRIGQPVLFSSSCGLDE